MDWRQMLVLAVVQGIAEFLPISSSGHLVIIEHLIGMRTDVTEANVFLHAGTLGSILVVYYHQIARLIAADRRVVGLLIVGTIPAVAVGLPITLLAKWLIETPLVAGLMLPVTGLMLLWIARRDGEEDYAKMTYGQALLVGAFQAFALLPGISRSGSTIVAGLLAGLKRGEAATFSFLLAIPAIALASAWEAVKLLTGQETQQTSWAMLLGGALVAFVVGAVALVALLKLLNRGRIHWFAYWCIPVGIATIVWQLIERSQ